MEWLNIAGAVGTLFMGLFGLLFPNAAARFVGLEATSLAGRSEFRATYGGLWLPLALIPVISQAPLAYAMAGFCWVGAAIGPRNLNLSG